MKIETEIANTEITPDGTCYSKEALKKIAEGMQTGKSRFSKNPIVLGSSIMPIVISDLKPMGKVESMGIKDGKLIGTIKLLPDSISAKHINDFVFATIMQCDEAIEKDGYRVFNKCELMAVTCRIKKDIGKPEKGRAYARRS